MYIYINYLNNFLINNREARAKVDPESRFEKLTVIEPDLLRVLLS